MVIILIVFIVSLLCSVLITPVIGKLGIRFGAMDYPHERKVHKTPIPRIGGAAIFLAFCVSLLLAGFLQNETAQFFLSRKMLFFFAGALICFGVGLLDDFKHLGYKIKFPCQVAAAALAFFGGLHINLLLIPSETFHFVPSFLITVLWFVLFINAVNLIDGLDGLAGGICFFASIMMVILSIMRSELLIALLYAALSGSILGFIRYNFNPASIFMGDSGSYLLGYLIAGLSVLGSQKSQVGAMMMIPLLAMGIPVFDTILAPIRRFILGQNMFTPDKGHIHHRLVKMGFSTGRTVLIIYGMSLALCILAIILVNLRDEQSGLFLIVLGVGAILFTHKLGYFEYIAYDKIYGWFKDVSDVAGFTRDRRSFLNMQLDLLSSKSIEELYENLCRIMDMLKFDMAVLNLQSNSNLVSKTVRTPSREEWVWTRKDLPESECISGKDLLKIEFPLLGKNNRSLGYLLLFKDLERDPITHYTLRRVEQLRRCMITCLDSMNKIDINPKPLRKVQDL